MCGIFGIYNCRGKDDIFTDLVNGLKTLQHRGKDSCGVSYTDGRDIHYEKYIGKIKGFNSPKSNILSGIGHVRYSTSGVSKEGNEVCFEEIQPLTKNNTSIVHNGNIPTITNSHDSKYLLDKIIQRKNTIEEALIDIMNTIPASYCILIITGTDLYILKDRYGIRPLSYGYKDGNVYLSSETVALSNCSDVTEVGSGEILKLNQSGIQRIYNHPKSMDCICLFEIIYFMNPSSYYNHKSIKSFREELSHQLAKKEDIIKDTENYIVIGIPNSGIIYGQTYAMDLSLQYKQLITKSTEDRTFISLNQMERKKACRKKFIYDKDQIKDKKLILLDDTIVRGNVIQTIINELRKLDPLEIHVRIPSPPVIDICQLGIAINTKEELLMSNRTVDEVRELINVDSLRYLELSDLTMIPQDSYKQCFGGGIFEEIVEKRIN